MKILFISSAEQPDYQCDCLYHGLKVVYGTDVEAADDMWYMYDTLLKDERNYLYGKGFTLYGLLDSTVKRVPPVNVIIEKIKSRYYQYIIYGSATRNISFLNIVLNNYTSNEVVFIDGEDTTVVNKKLMGVGVYFKRELETSLPRVYPISFAIPAEKIIEHTPEKIRDWAKNYPGKLNTYIFNDELSYYQDYRFSKYAVTFKKAGWDCLRHYEIIANGCLPYFKDILHCPDKIIQNFPKGIIKEIFHKLQGGNDLKIDEYHNYVDLLLAHCRENLTTEALANYVIKTAQSVKEADQNKVPGINFTEDIIFINDAIKKHTTNTPYIVSYRGVSSVQKVRYFTLPKGAILYAEDEFISAEKSLKKITNYLNKPEVPTVIDLAIIDMALVYQDDVHQYIIDLIHSISANSKVIFILPNYLNYSTVLNFIKGDYKFGRLKLAKSSQVNFYSKKTIGDFLNKYGFEVSGLEGFEYDNSSLIKSWLNKVKPLKYLTCKKIIVEAYLKDE